MLANYKNGNYTVTLFEDGTKCRFNNEDHFSPQFPESIDMSISTLCDNNCPMCYMGCSMDGKFANLNHPLLNSLHAGTELAINCNFPAHPDLIPFLKRMAAQGIICNTTLHLTHFTNNYNFVKELADQRLIHGIGISVNDTITDDQIALITSLPNAIVHCIAGIVPWNTLVKMANHNIKLLILGYKTYGRGEAYVTQNHYIAYNINHIYEHMNELREWFPIISFDNLALEQLNVREFVDEETWNLSFLGADGTFTMYVDLVEESYAPSSISPRKPLGSIDNIDELFADIRRQ